MIHAPALLQCSLIFSEFVLIRSIGSFTITLDALDRCPLRKQGGQPRSGGDRVRPSNRIAAFAPWINDSRCEAGGSASIVTVLTQLWHRQQWYFCLPEPKTFQDHPDIA
jgi:hypothetical protein